MKSLSKTFSEVCYVIKSVRDVVIPPAILIVCFAIFHVQLRHGLMLWRRDMGSAGIFKQQKKFMKIISGIGNRLLVGRY
jgi:hypothetical protein